MSTTGHHDYPTNPQEAVFTNSANKDSHLEGDKTQVADYAMIGEELAKKEKVINLAKRIATIIDSNLSSFKTPPNADAKLRVAKRERDFTSLSNTLKEMRVLTAEEIVTMNNIATEDNEAENFFSLLEELEQQDRDAAN